MSPFAAHAFVVLWTDLSIRWIVLLLFHRQDVFANALVETASDEQGMDSVPARLRVVVRQLDGLADGYAQAVEGAESQPLRALRRTELHLLNSVGDMLDLFAKAKSPIPWASMSPSEVLTTVATAGHCSALIKVRPRLRWVFRHCLSCSA
jgi:hypothetical protein